MSWTPTDEQVEKVAWKVADWLSDRDEGPSEAHREAARAVFVAVGPMIAAQALRDAGDVWEGRSPAPTAFLRARATRIEKEAGR